MDYALHSHYTLRDMPENNKQNDWFKNLVVNIVPVGVLTWALAALTASYFGYAQNIDSAFISSLVTTVLASYGITRVDNRRR